MAGGYNVFAKDIWSEGTRYPLLKIVEAGQGAARRRAHDAGQQPAARLHRRPALAGRRRTARCAPARPRSSSEYGADTVDAAVDWTIADAHRRFSAEIARWPDGTYEADVYVDSDPAGKPDIHVHVAVTVDGDRLIVDFAGSDDRPEIQAWSTFGNTRGYTIAQLASLVDPSIPKNEGFFDCIDLRVPRRYVREPARGKAGFAAARTTRASRSATRSRSRWRRSSPTGAPADLQVRQPAPDVGRRGPAHRQAVLRPRRRGQRRLGQRGAGRRRLGCAVASNGNLIKASAEINEALFPHILRGRNYLTDSGGAGQWRGGCGSHFVKEVRTPTSVNQYVVNQRHTHPGIAGGDNGSPDQCVLAEGTDEVEVEPTVAGAAASKPASGSSTTSAAAAGGATRWRATRRPCSTTCGTSTCRSTGARATTASSSPAPSTT